MKAFYPDSLNQVFAGIIFCRPAGFPGWCLPFRLNNKIPGLHLSFFFLSAACWSLSKSGFWFATDSQIILIFISDTVHWRQTKNPELWNFHNGSWKPFTGWKWSRLWRGSSYLLLAQSRSSSTARSMLPKLQVSFMLPAASSCLQSCCSLSFISESP